MTIDDNVICAVDRTSEGQDACQGDSGGPLMFEAGGLIGDDSYTLTPDRSSRWILIGVVSFGCVCQYSTLVVLDKNGTLSRLIVPIR